MQSFHIPSTPVKLTRFSMVQPKSVNNCFKNFTRNNFEVLNTLGNLLCRFYAIYPESFSYYYDIFLLPKDLLAATCCQRA